MSQSSFVAGKDDAGRRLDRIVRRILRDAPLSLVYRMFREGAIRLNGRKAAGEDRVAPGDEITVRMSQCDAGPGLSAAPDPTLAAAFEAMLLARTPDIAVVNKPRGCLSHGPEGLDRMAAAYFSAEAAASLAFVPAPLHRLDRNTSGSLAVSASLRGAVAFSQALRDGQVRKEYLAVLDGELADTTEWLDGLGRDDEGKTSHVTAGGGLAHTIATPLAARGGRTLASIRILTGLTHQIRVQCAAHGHPLSGDGKYGSDRDAGGYLLHCAFLGFPQSDRAEFPESALAPLHPWALARLRGLFGPYWRDALPARLRGIALD